MGTWVAACAAAFDFCTISAPPCLVLCTILAPCATASSLTLPTRSQILSKSSTISPEKSWIYSLTISTGDRSRLDKPPSAALELEKISPSLSLLALLPPSSCSFPKDLTLIFLLPTPTLYDTLLILGLLEALLLVFSSSSSSLVSITLESPKSVSEPMSCP